MAPGYPANAPTEAFFLLTQSSHRLGLWREAGDELGGAAGPQCPSLPF